MTNLWNRRDSIIPCTPRSLSKKQKYPEFVFPGIFHSVNTRKFSRYPQPSSGSYSGRSARHKQFMFSAEGDVCGYAITTKLPSAEYPIIALHALPQSLRDGSLRDCFVTREGAVEYLITYSVDRIALKRGQKYPFDGTMVEFKVPPTGAGLRPCPQIRAGARSLRP